MVSLFATRINQHSKFEFARVQIQVCPDTKSSRTRGGNEARGTIDPRFHGFAALPRVNTSTRLSALKGTARASERASRIPVSSEGRGQGEPVSRPRGGP